MGGAECPSGSGCKYGNLAGNNKKLLDTGIAKLVLFLQTGEDYDITSKEVIEYAKKNS